MLFSVTVVSNWEQNCTNCCLVRLVLQLLSKLTVLIWFVDYNKFSILAGGGFGPYIKGCIYSTKGEEGKQLLAIKV